MSDEFNKKCGMDYRFWILIISFLSFCAMIYFACQAHEIQTTLKLIEETRKKESFVEKLKITFKVEPALNNKPEDTNYDFQLHNKSSHIYKSLETSVKAVFENINTREIKKAEAFSFPKRDILPSDKSIYLIPNPQLSKTFRHNISECKKGMDKAFKPKCFYFTLKWNVDIGDEEPLIVEKRKNFVMDKIK